MNGTQLIQLLGIIEFQWDKGNKDKNWKKHRVGCLECEQVFFNIPRIVKDKKHSKKESRYFALGETDFGRLLSVVFTIKDNKIRVISARKMNNREEKEYVKIKKGK